jgi:hypothetical protein
MEMLDEEAIVGVRNSHQIMRQQRIRTFNTNARKDHLTGDSSLMGKPPKQTKFEVEPQLFPSRFGREMACQLVASPMEMAEDDDHSNFPRPQGTFIPGPTFIRMENTEPRSSVIPSTVVEDDMDEVGFQRLTDCWASNLGICYLLGLGTVRDNSNAVMYFRASAEKEHPVGQEMLAIMLAYGYGVYKNLRDSVCLFRLAANNGMSESQFRMGCAYAHG